MGITWTTPPAETVACELHLDSPDGKKIGTFNFGHAKTASSKMIIDPVTDGKKHRLYIVHVSGNADLSGGPVSSVYMQFFNK
jgi:hypothetical protein